MKNLSVIYISILTVVMAVTQYSCNKGLDLKPLDQLSDASYWQTPNDFMLAANKFYTYQRTFVDVLQDNPHSDSRSDYGGINAFSRGLNTAPTSDGTYNTDYTRIREINYLLAKAAAYASPADIKKYVAEAKFFRAYLYFDLLQVYGAVPLVTKPLGTGSVELMAPRTGRDSIADFIIADLNAAIPDLPLESANAATDKGRITKGSAQAFLSRVALFEGTWQKFRNGSSARYSALLDMAVTASNQVISSNEYALFAPAVLGDSALKYLMILENQKSNPAGVQKSANKEYIQANRYDQAIRQVRFNISQTGTPGFTRRLANIYLCNDGLPIEKSALFQGYALMKTEFANRDNRMRYNMKVAGGYYWKGNNNWHINWDWSAPDLANADASPWRPYANTTSGYGGQKWVAERQVPDNEESYDYPVIRYAEVLLIYAEAAFERNGTITDAELDKSLNLVRNRVNKTMPKLSNAFVAANGLDMRREIRRERTVEFVGEGFRTDDLKRWHNAVGGPNLGADDEDPLIGSNVMLQKVLGIKWAGTEFQTAWPSQSATAKYSSANIYLDGALVIDAARSFSEKNYLLPVPTTQIQLNPNLSQNPNW
ncbi:MAG: RagB/SusD family nutrient uptake outer membrane protein [Chitinophagaceae bacterium]